MSGGKRGLQWATALICVVLGTPAVRAQDAQIETVRHTKSKVQPVYPDLARRMNLTGTVKLSLVVSANGMVKDAKVVGGHPVLANAALDAVRKWRFEPAPTESSGIVDIKFEPHQ